MEILRKIEKEIITNLPYQTIGGSSIITYNHASSQDFHPSYCDKSETNVVVPVTTHILHDFSRVLLSFDESINIEAFLEQNINKFVCDSLSCYAAAAIKCAKDKGLTFININNKEMIYDAIDEIYYSNNPNNIYLQANVEVMEQLKKNCFDKQLTSNSNGKCYQKQILNDLCIIFATRCLDKEIIIFSDCNSFVVTYPTIYMKQNEIYISFRMDLPSLKYTKGFLLIKDSN